MPNTPYSDELCDSVCATRDVPSSCRICHTMAASTAPGSISRVPISLAVASRKPYQNTPMFSTSDTAIAATWPPRPRDFAALAATPDSSVVSSSPMPTARISPMSRSMDQGNPGRRKIGTPHTVFSAFCAALATPRAPRNVRMRPMARAGPVWLSPCTLFCSCGPITGNWPNAESSTLSFSDGLLRSTMSSTVTRTSSSGNSAAKP